MFEMLVRETSGRSKARMGAGAALALCVTALVLGGTSTAHAQSEACDVTISVDNGADLRALQLDITVPTSGGFELDSCDSVPANAFVDLNEGDPSTVAWTSVNTFTGPGDIMTCTFISSVSPATATSGDFGVTIVDASGSNPPNPPAIAPTVSVNLGACVAATPSCGNAVIEVGESCDDGNLVEGDGCSATCLATGSCSATPLGGCLQGEAGKSKIKLKDDINNPASNAKDQAQYQWKKGAALDGADLGDPANNSSVVYSLCIYDNGALIAGADVPGGGTCDGKPCWKGTPEKGFQYKSKTGQSDGIAKIKVKPGVAGKTQVQVQGKSKAGNWSTPTLPLTTPVLAQVSIADGDSTLCVDTNFTATPKKNEAKQVQIAGP